MLSRRSPPALSMGTTGINPDSSVSPSGVLYEDLWYTSDSSIEWKPSLSPMKATSRWTSRGQQPEPDLHGRDGRSRTDRPWFARWRGPFAPFVPPPIGRQKCLIRFRNSKHNQRKNKQTNQQQQTNKNYENQHSNKCRAARLGHCFPGMATDPVVYLTGSTAFRSTIIRSISNNTGTSNGGVFDAGSVTYVTWGNSAASQLPITWLFHGTITNGSPVYLDCAWSGSEAGIASACNATLQQHGPQRQSHHPGRLAGNLG